MLYRPSRISGWRARLWKLNHCSAMNVLSDQGCYPIHTYPGAYPYELNETYFWIHMQRTELQEKQNWEKWKSLFSSRYIWSPILEPALQEPCLRWKQGLLISHYNSIANIQIYAECKRESFQIMGWEEVVENRFMLHFGAFHASMEVESNQQITMTRGENQFLWRKYNIQQQWLKEESYSQSFPGYLDESILNTHTHAHALKNWN